MTDIQIVKQEQRNNSYYNDQSPKTINQNDPIIGQQDEILHCLPYGLVFLDKEHQIIKANRKAEVYLNSHDYEEMLNNLNHLIQENVHSLEECQSGPLVYRSLFGARFKSSNFFLGDVTPSNWNHSPPILPQKNYKCSDVVKSSKIIRIQKNETNGKNYKRLKNYNKESIYEMQETPLKSIFKNKSMLNSSRFIQNHSSRNKINNSFPSDQHENKYLVKCKIKGKEKILRLRFLEVNIENQDNQIEIKNIVIIENVTNKEQYRQLKKKYNIQESVINSFSHEFRTPINQCLQLLECLEESLEYDLNQTYLLPAKVSVTKLLYQINDIIDIQSLQCGNFTMSFKDIKVRDLIEHIKELYKYECQSKGISLKIEADDNILSSMIKSDLNRIIQILVNLINNSVKFTPQNGLIILQITKRRLLNSFLYYFSVYDNGIGIKISKLNEIQSVISNINQDGQSQEDFIGLGLTVCQQLCQFLCRSLQEDIYIQSKEGEYTKIGFYVEDFNFTQLISEPSDGVPNDGEQPIQQIYTFSSSFKKKLECECTDVLVCDDIAFNHLALNNLFKKFQITIDSAYDGKQALDLVINKYTIDHGCSKFYKIILMDIEMPGKDGFETTNDIFKFYKQNKISQSVTKIIMSSAYTGKQLYKKAKKSGMIDSLPKPIILNDLKRILDLYYFKL